MCMVIVVAGACVGDELLSVTVHGQPSVLPPENKFKLPQPRGVSVLPAASSVMVRGAWARVEERPGLWGGR